MFGPPTATKVSWSGSRPARPAIHRPVISVEAPRAVTPIFLPFRSCMNAGQPLPALGVSTWLPTSSAFTLVTAPPATIFILAPRSTAPFITSAGPRAESMLFASIAWIPSGAAGIGCSSHLMPAFSQ